MSMCAALLLLCAEWGLPEGHATHAHRHSGAGLLPHSPEAPQEPRLERTEREAVGGSQRLLQRELAEGHRGLRSNGLGGEGSFEDQRFPAQFPDEGDPSTGPLARQLLAVQGGAKAPAVHNKPDHVRAAYALVEKVS